MYKRLIGPKILAFTCIAGAWSCGTTDTKSGLAFYGPDSRRARMSFDTEVVVATDVDVPARATKDELLGRFGDEIEDTINTQLAHMFGTFTTHTSPEGTDFVTYPGIPRELPDIEITDAKRLDARRMIVLYRYYDIVVFHKDFIARSALDHEAEFLYTEDDGRKRRVQRQARWLNFYLPREPGRLGESIYAHGCTDGRLDKSGQLCNRGKNRCTHHEYNSLGDFWYFWDPKQTNEESRFAEPKACPIPEEQLVTVKAHLAPMNSTAPENPSSPDYFRLYGEDRPNQHKTIVVHYLVGIDHDFSKKDLGYLTYQQAIKLLTKGRLGILKPLNDAEKIRAYFPDNQSTDFTVFLTRAISPKVDVVMKVELFDPNEERPEDAGRLAALGKSALTEADIFIYDGHSGLGGYWAVDNFFDDGLTLPKNKYQIFFFNGCSTFAYYNHDYFAQKERVDGIVGRTNLDVVTNGIGASFDIGPESDARFLYHLLSGERKDWVAILDDMYAVDKWDTALVQVNGDENNPRRPMQDGSCRGTPQHPTWLVHKPSGMCRPSDDPVFE